MKAINNGQHVTITATFEDMALLIGMLEKGAHAYRELRLDEFVDDADKLLYTVRNPEVRIY